MRSPVVMRPRPLLAALAALGAFGAFLLLAPRATRTLFGWIAWGDPGRLERLPADAVAYVGLAHAVLGAATLGWAAGLGAVVAVLWRTRPRAAWWIVAGSLAVWFVPDTAYSLAHGFPRNAVFNACCALPFAAALAVAYPRAHSPGSDAPRSRTAGAEGVR